MPARAPLPGPLRPMLEGGDRRSLAGSRRALAATLARPERVAELAALAMDRDWLVSMRAVDLLEKLARSHPAWVQPHRQLLIGPLAASDKWEIRLQIVRCLPLLVWTPKERRRVLEILRRDIHHPQKFVRAWALDGLAAMARPGSASAREVERALRDFETSGSKALATRALLIRERIEAASARDGPVRAAGRVERGGPYLAVPRSGRGPGVVVLHAWWGLTAAVLRICDRLAAEGFTAIAPDLYGGKIARTLAEARALRAAPRREPAYRTIERAVKALLIHPSTAGGRLGVVGLSMGGHWALWLATRPEHPVAATVVFYAARASAFARGPPSAFQIHLAERDPYVSPAGIARMRKALSACARNAEVHVYEGTRHWFLENDRPEYDRAAAGVAWERSLAFLRKHLRRHPGRALARSRPIA